MKDGISDELRRFHRATSNKFAWATLQQDRVWLRGCGPYHGRLYDQRHARVREFFLDRIMFDCQPEKVCLMFLTSVCRRRKQSVCRRRKHMSASTRQASPMFHRPRAASASRRPPALLAVDVATPQPRTPNARQGWLAWRGLLETRGVEPSVEPRGGRRRHVSTSLVRPARDNPAGVFGAAPVLSPSVSVHLRLTWRAGRCYAWPERYPPGRA